MRVVLYGSSLLMRGMEASLKAQPGLELASLQTDIGQLREQVRRLQPKAVMVEAGALPDEVGMALLRDEPGLVLVTLDPECSRVRLLSGRQAQTVTSKDLLRLIEASRESAPSRPLVQAHLDRLSQLARAGLTVLCILPRRQKLVLAFAAMVACAILVLLLSPAGPQANAFLVGTATGGFAPEVGLWLGVGIMLGALVVALALGWQHLRSQSMIPNSKMDEGEKTIDQSPDGIIVQQTSTKTDSSTKQENPK